MGIVHVAIYDAAVAIEGGYRPYAHAAAPANTSPEAAIATAAYDTLIGLQPQLGASDQTILDDDYAAYLASVPDGAAKVNGIAVGAAGRPGGARAARRRRPRVQHHAAGPRPAAPGPGVWQPNATGAVLGLCLPACGRSRSQSASQFRPDGPNALTSRSTPTTSTRSKELGRATARAGRRSRRPGSSGPTTTSASGTTACSRSRPTAGSTSCRPRGCWRWRTSPAATR
jgi:hypothetical protein